MRYSWSSCVRVRHIGAQTDVVLSSVALSDTTWSWYNGSSMFPYGRIYHATWRTTFWCSCSTMCQKNHAKYHLLQLIILVLIARLQTASGHEFNWHVLWCVFLWMRWLYSCQNVCQICHTLQRIRVTYCVLIILYWLYSQLVLTM